MTFYNNSHAAQAILENRHKRLHEQIATKRTSLVTRIMRKAIVVQLPQTEPAARAA